MEASLNALGYTNVFSKVNASRLKIVLFSKIKRLLTYLLSYCREKGTFNSFVVAGFFGVNPKIEPVYVFRDFISGAVDIQIFQFRVHPARDASLIVPSQKTCRIVLYTNFVRLYFLSKF